MPARRRLPPSLLRTLATLALAAAGGGVCDLAGLPGAWLAGSAILVAGAALAGFEVGLPQPLRNITFVVLGVSMGAGMQPETVHRIAEWPVSLAVLLLTVAAVTAAVAVFLVRAAGWDRDSALFAALPGALSYVIAAAASRRADVRRVATSQSIRLMFLIGVLPLVVGGGRPPVAPAALAAGLGELALLLSVGGIVGLAAEKARMPAGLLTGAFLSSAVLHATGTVSLPLPTWLTLPAFAVLGAFVGTRFSGADVGAVVRVAWSSVGALAVGLLVATAGALVTVWLTGQSLGAAFLAFAPGGIEAMTGLAFLLHVDPAYVAVHQLARFIAIALTLPLVLRLLGPPPTR
jgi:hypothetical protein